MFTIKEEEKVSFYSHFVGFIMAVIGTILLIYVADGFSLKIVTIIYGISVIILFLASSLYHAHKKYEGEVSLWRKLDHIAIFIMIAGTYTPVCYIFLSGYWKWSIILLQWLLVLGGLFFKFFYFNAPRYLYTIIYIFMGWIGIAPLKKFINTMSTTSLLLLIGGGISYTIGAIFYIFKKPQFNKYFGFHEIFHLFILMGAFFHYFLVYLAVM